MIDPTLGMIAAKILAVTAAVSLLGAGIHLVPTRRTHGILVLVAAVVMMATFVMVRPDLSGTEALIVNGLVLVGSVGTAVNIVVVWFRYRNNDGRDSYVIFRASVVAALSGTATLSATLSVLAAWDSPWRIAIVVVMATLAVIAAVLSVVDAPERSTV